MGQTHFLLSADVYAIGVDDDQVLVLLTDPAVLLLIPFITVLDFAMAKLSLQNKDIIWHCEESTFRLLIPKFFRRPEQLTLIIIL